MAQSIVNDPKSWGKKDADEALRAKMIVVSIAEVRHIFANDESFNLAKEILAVGGEVHVTLKFKF